MTTFGAHLGAIYAAAYTPDGDSIVTGSEDKIARLWRMPRCQALIDAARMNLPHGFTSPQQSRYFLANDKGSTEAPLYAWFRGMFSLLLPSAGDTCH